MSEDFMINIISILGMLMPFIMILIINRALKEDIIQKNKFRRKMFRKMYFIDKHQEFEYFYNKIKNETNFRKVKAEGRKNILKVFLGICIIVSGLCVSIVLSKNINISVAIILFLICVFIGALIVSSRTYKSKNLVIKKLISMIKPEIEYDDLNKKFTALNFYHQSGFRDPESNREYVTDYMKYELSYGTVVEMADIHLQYYKKDVGIYDDYEDKILEIFEGIIVKVNRDKDIENEILIERNKFLKWENWIKKDNFRFEKLFDVYAKNKDVIESLISSQVENELIELYKKYGIMFEISIKGKNLFIRFFTGSLFESMAFGTLWSKKKLYKEYVVFTSILDIINKINEIL